MIHPDDMYLVCAAIAKQVGEVLTEIDKETGEETKYVLVIFPSGATACPCGTPHVFVASNSRKETLSALMDAGRKVSQAPDLASDGELN